MNINTPSNPFTTHNPVWFKNWFDSSFYHQLYAHRDEKEAANFIDELLSELQPSAKSSMLDLGCGVGRHAKYLASKGFAVTGIDLSFSSIHKAQKFESPWLQFYRRDMRTPFGSNLFDYVFNFFTSFGYFSDLQDNHIVLGNIHSALKPGGKVIIDYLNVGYSENRITPSEEKSVDGVRYFITRWHDQNFFFKKIQIDDVMGGKPFEHTEQVSKFTLPCFEQMMEKQKLRIENVFGNYQLDKYDTNTSERLIIVASKV